MLNAPDAHAGSYGSAQYTGGQYTITGAAKPVSYAPLSPGVWGAPPATGYGPGSPSVTIACSGPVQASFPYTHGTGQNDQNTHGTGQNDQNDPPPPVIITEQCSVSWSGTAGTGYPPPAPIQQIQ